MTIRSLRLAGLLMVAVAASAAVAPLSLSAPNPGAFLGVPYNSGLVASGGFPPYTFSITGGSLPPGLTLNTSTGAITGTPNNTGVFTFTAMVTDSAGGSFSQALDSAHRNSTPRAGSPAASVSSSFTITVSAGGVPGAPLPPSVLLAAIGLVFAGLYRMWRGRQTA